jgi:hypothetical protein
MQHAQQATQLTCIQKQTALDAVVFAQSTTSPLNFLWYAHAISLLVACAEAAC